MQSDLVRGRRGIVGIGILSDVAGLIRLFIIDKAGRPVDSTGAVANRDRPEGYDGPLNSLIHGPIDG